MRVFLNAYLDENFGDDLFVEVIAQRYPNHQFDILAPENYGGKFSSNVNLKLSNNLTKEMTKEDNIIQKLWKCHLPNRYFYPKLIRPSYRIRNALAKKSDKNIYVIGSGFMENVKYNFMDYLVDLSYYNQKLSLIGCNFGPYQSESYLTYHKRLFKRAYDVCFRDSKSALLFNELSNCRQEMDVVFAYKGGEQSPLTSDFGDYVLISVVNPIKDNNDDNDSSVQAYLSFLKDCIDQIYNQGKKVVLVGFCRRQNDDVMINQLLKISSHVEDIEVFNYPDISFEQMLGLFSGAQSVIASRYHAMVVSMLYQRPTYTIAYSKKTINVLKDIDETIPYISTEDLSLVSSFEFLNNYGYKISDDLLLQVKMSAEKQFEKIDKKLL